MKFSVLYIYIRIRAINNTFPLLAVVADLETDSSFFLLLVNTRKCRKFFNLFRPYKRYANVKRLNVFIIIKIIIIIY